ncbi:unnamed protein product [Rotaria magnacalcarata]|uniref:Uncharacterized protein n=3 Tax=Rotaria magnacalcarata TaxID=392030 RepID=A0A816K9R2_9BILA|nr:unnamed protein product [Rotaria magnacalcarata]
MSENQIDVWLNRNRPILMQSILVILILLTFFAGVSIDSIYMTANDSSSTSCTCIIDIKNRVRFLKEINDTCPTILATNECYMDLPQAPLYCSITNYWFIIWKIIIFGAFILDIIIPIVIWGRSSKPNILFSLAAFGIIIGTFFFTELYIVLFCQLTTLLVAWIFMLHFVCKPKFG